MKHTGQTFVHACGHHMHAQGSRYHTTGFVIVIHPCACTGVHAMMLGHVCKHVCVRTLLFGLCATC